jgi:hypothetical protein
MFCPTWLPFSEMGKAMGGGKKGREVWLLNLLRRSLTLILTKVFSRWLDAIRAKLICNNF